MNAAFLGQHMEGTQVLETIAAYLFTKLADEAYAKAKEILLRELAQTMDHTTKTLERIETKIDTQISAPLRAGITFLGLGDLDQAIRELVRADALEGVAPVTKTCLGLCLALRGQLAEGATYIHQAASMNPFLVARILSMESTFRGRISTVAIDNSYEEWTRDLKTVRPRLAAGPGGVIRTKHIPRSTTITRASISDGMVCVAWRFGDCLRSGKNNVFSRKNYGFDLRSVISNINAHNGEILWTRESSGLDLLFMSPEFVVVQSDKDPYGLQLWSSETGEVLKQVSRAYFALTFCPDIRSIEHDNVYRAANRTMTGLKRVLEVMDFELDTVKSYHSTDDVYEVEVLQDIYGSRADNIQIQNVYTLTRVLEPPGWVDTVLRGKSAIMKMSNEPQHDAARKVLTELFKTLNVSKKETI